MDTKYLNPFITATTNAIETMVGIDIKAGVPFSTTDPSPTAVAGVIDISFKAVDARQFADITGVVGFASSKLLGSVALAFTESVALKIYNSMMGENVTSINSDVGDAIGELANIICGSAKTEFSLMKLTYDISIPSIVQGTNHRVTFKRDIPTVVIPFILDGNEQFHLEIALKLFPED